LLPTIISVIVALPPIAALLVVLTQSWAVATLLATAALTLELSLLSVLALLRVAALLIALTQSWPVAALLATATVTLELPLLFCWGEHRPIAALLLSLT